MMSKFFTGVNIRQMDLDGRNTNARNGVSKSDAGMGIGSGVDHNDLKITFGLLNPGHEVAFQVGLTKFDLDPSFTPMASDLAFNVGEGGAAIDFRLALAKQIQIRPVQK